MGERMVRNRCKKTTERSQQVQILGAEAAKVVAPGHPQHAVQLTLADQRHIEDSFAQIKFALATEHLRRTQFEPQPRQQLPIVDRPVKRRKKSTEIRRERHRPSQSAQCRGQP